MSRSFAEIAFTPTVLAEQEKNGSAEHYAGFQEHLDRMMGWVGRLALLTQGEADPRFFSHAYFARYLSANLVEPADLTVRDGAAFVKTLDGLKRVDVLLRGGQMVFQNSFFRSAFELLYTPLPPSRKRPTKSIIAKQPSLLNTSA